MVTPLARPEDLLTPRQLEVLELVSKGLTNREIAQLLGIAPGTAKNHVAAVLEALDVSNRTEAIGLMRDLDAGGGAPPDTAPRADPSPIIPRFGNRPALAILPFDNLGPGEDAHVADGLVEDLTTAMSAWRWFPVIARNSCFAYRGSGVDVRMVSRELGARYVLEGSARRAGSRLRVQVQLIDGESGHHLFAQKYDRTFEDLFSVQDQIVSDIVAVLEPALSQVERLRALRQPIESLSAWEWLQRGLHLLWRQQPGDPREAVGLFQRALSSAPDSGTAWSALALGQCMNALHAEADDLVEELRQAETSARRAIECDPMDAMAHLALGTAAGVFRRIDEAERAFQRAVDLNPSYALGHFATGVSLLSPGRQRESAAHFELALRLSPRDPLRHHFHGGMAGALAWLGDYEEALEHARASVAAQPSAVISYQPAIASILGHLGRHDEARAVRDRILAEFPTFDLGATRLLAHEELVEHFAEGFRRFGWEVD